VSRLRRFIVLVTLIITIVALLAGVAFAKEVKSRSFTAQEIEKMAGTTVMIKTSFGNIELMFYPDLAPNHVDNFIQLAGKGFYDGTVFHRVIPGFMVQGGDPNTKSPNRARHGIGGPGHTVKAEFSARKHTRGILSMARMSHPDSGGSQFFLIVKDSPWLDNKYSVFGEVISGMDVVDRLVNQPRDRRDNPLERVELKMSVVEPQETEPQEPESEDAMDKEDDKDDSEKNEMKKSHKKDSGK
jgi:peptidyl-prolyl cis-trans isomerase B (cyclophilin B)